MPPAPIPTNDPERLATLREYGVLDSLRDQAYEDIIALATYICGTPISLISLIDESRQWFKAEVGIGASQTSREESFCAYTIENPQTLVVEDAQNDPRFADNPLVTGDPNIRFYAGAPLVAPNGHVLGTICVIDSKPRTITPDQIKALEALARQVMSLLKARLRIVENEVAAAAIMQNEKLAAVGRLASSMAHGINNPLEAVTNLLYLSRQQSVDPEVRVWLDLADQELRRVATIANQTLRFHKQSTNPQAITCEELIAATLLVFEARLRNCGITVETRKRAHDPIEVFEGDIRQVLSNLVSNAIDAMSMGGKLWVRSREATDWRSNRRGFVLTLADNGSGMTAETQARMFEAFFSTKGIGGSGLGLWISAEIMARHKGRIAIRTKQGAGTVVTLFLPFA